jgi:hypothetical protein
VPRIPDSLVYDGWTAKQIAVAKRNDALFLAMFASASCAVGIALLDRMWQVAAWGGVHALFAVGQFWEARQQDKILEIETIREVMDA